MNPGYPDRKKKTHCRMKLNTLIISGLLLAGPAGAQNVGIGTTTPVAKLDVMGNIKITDGSQGAGKVLTSDAAGLASWQLPPESPPSGPSSSSYPSIRIDCNSWMTRNLDVATYANGDTIPMVTDAAAWAALTTGAYCYYNNDSATYAAVYGKLYNWYAINDSRGLAPDGYHVPSEFEWSTLGTALGGNSSAGGWMKEIGTANWNAPNTGATNYSNFTARPGGYRDANGVFHQEGDFGYWWTSTQGTSNFAWNRKLNYNDSVLQGGSAGYKQGLSVRCVKD